MQSFPLTKVSQRDRLQNFEMNISLTDTGDTIKELLYEKFWDSLCVGNNSSEEVDGVNH
jgi:hypothetical protein